MSDMPPADVAYVGTSGVLHPSESAYELLRRRSPWGDGHARYEGVSVLVSALHAWPDVRIVLTSPLPRVHGPESVVESLGLLTQRVVGHTFQDLTTQARRQVVTRGGSTRTVGFSSEDYWRMNKSDIVAAHVAWLRPSRWVVIDEEDILWPRDVRRDRLVLTDGCLGLLGADVQDRLHTVMHMNFGR